MKKAFKHIPTLVAAVVMGSLFVACTDDDNYSIKEAKISISATELGQLEAYSYAIPFKLETDADAEWEATVEWDDETTDQPAYVYPKKGTGPALLKIVTLDNRTQSPRQATLKITFPKDPSKNITQVITQKRGADTNDGKDIEEGNITRGIGYGYNCFDGYAELNCMITPILKVNEMYDEKALIYDFSSLQVEQREESGASCEEMARKLNASMHASASNWGLSVTVDAKFNAGQKKTESNEFAWMDINAVTCTAVLNGPQDDLIFDYMTDGAYNNINGIPTTRHGKEIIKYPATDEGFAKLVMNYGTHLVVGGKLGGQLHTQVTANTSKITTAYNASVALEVTYSGPFSSDVNSNTKAQIAKAQSKNHNAFYFDYKLLGGGRDDDTFQALNSVLGKMTKARQASASEESLTDDSELNVKIDDTSAEYEAAADAWKKSLMPTGSSASEREDALKNVVLVDFAKEENLVPIYELVDRYLTEDEDGVDGEARYQAFKDWYERKLMADPSIIKRYKPKSEINTPPTIVDPIIDLTKADTKKSLVWDVYLSNGQHVARVCSEFIPLINPTKRVNVIYPIVNGKVRYNLGIFCGDEVTYPYYVSWGQVDDPSTPLITQIKGLELGGYKVAYLRGNHLTLEPDENFSDEDYLKTTAEPYNLISKDNDKELIFPVVKINDYIYTRDLYRARTYQNGAAQMSDKVPYDEDKQFGFSPFYRGTKNIDWYLVSNYTNSLHRWGGFAPQGWTVPYYSQYDKMIQNLADIPGKKPDGTIGASFLENGVYGLNTYATGCIIIEHDTGDKDGKVDEIARCNEKILYLGALSDVDKEKLDGTDNVYGKRGDLQSMFDCPALAVEPATGNVSMTRFWDKTITIIDNHQFVGDGYFPEWLRGKGGDWSNLMKHLQKVYETSSFDNVGYKMCYPIIICQKAVK
ncbi:MAG: hypothetical protein J6O54_00465 [Prevotella sp.]|nr:hypothetical protein [Prevotella sp.]